jgi:hypothetical protein
VGKALERAVFTIPVDFGGMERKALRAAAGEADIGVIQFVHEPAAALYAYLRTNRDHATSLFQRLGQLEGQVVLVFDWGGGTLDLTLCRVQGGTIVQIASRGNNTIGGDRFDELLRNLVRSSHGHRFGLEDTAALEQPGMGAKLLHRCEAAKMLLSEEEVETEIIIPNFLRRKEGRDLRAVVTRGELVGATDAIVRSGLAMIDELLDFESLSHNDVALCLAIGGMANMPAIHQGLSERFIGRLPRVPHSDRIIAEGAAWIAHDNLPIKLAKPIELLVADTSGLGTYYTLAPAGWELPRENEIKLPRLGTLRLFCTDPRDGVASVEVCKPCKPDRTMPSDPRSVIGQGQVLVDPTAGPLMERIKCELKIDHDYIATLTLESTARKAKAAKLEFHDLDFALALPTTGDIPVNGDRGPGAIDDPGTGRSLRSMPKGNLALRTNLGVWSNRSSEVRPLVPGDLAESWWPNYFDVQSTEPTPRQRSERNFYLPCSRCQRLDTEIRAEGCAMCGLAPVTFGGGPPATQAG